MTHRNKVVGFRIVGPRLIFPKARDACEDLARKDVGPSNSYLLRSTRIMQHVIRCDAIQILIYSEPLVYSFDQESLSCKDASRSFPYFPLHKITAMPEAFSINRYHC